MISRWHNTFILMPLTGVAAPLHHYHDARSYNVADIAVRPFASPITHFHFYRPSARDYVPLSTYDSRIQDAFSSASHVSFVSLPSHAELIGRYIKSFIYLTRKSSCVEDTPAYSSSSSLSLMMGNIIARRCAFPGERFHHSEHGEISRAATLFSRDGHSHTTHRTISVTGRAAMEGHDDTMTADLLLIMMIYSGYSSLCSYAQRQYSITVYFNAFFILYYLFYFHLRTYSWNTFILSLR